MTVLQLDRELTEDARELGAELYRVASALEACSTCIDICPVGAM